MERAAKGEPHVFAFAVNGSRPDERGENIIWGWARIAKTMQQSPPFNNPEDPSHKDFVNLFHQARYNMAYCNYQQALGQTVKDERDKYLKAADYALTITEQYAPDLGGDDWKPKYTELRNKVQSALKS